MSTVADPRSHVTPDAFAISPEVLGLPLATPKRRLAAIALDGIGVGIVSQLDWRLLGVVAAIAFFRASSRKATGGRVGRAFQYSVGCLGALILFVTVVASTEFVRSLLLPEPERAESGEVGMGDVLGGGMALLRLSQVQTEEEAVDVGIEVVRRAIFTLEQSPEDALELVRTSLPGDRGLDVEAVLAQIAAEIPEVEAPVPTQVAAAPVDSLGLAQLWDEFTTLDAADSLTAAEEDRLAEVRGRLAGLVAADSLDTLERRLQGTREDVDALERRLADTEDELEEEREGGGLFSWLVGTIDELGLTFGWGALYFATFTTLMKGQTPGKRLLGIRVVRLDGHPIGWFHAFERAGGYAAGVATGLLGFFQVFWDPNRQGIHDKVVATVVVREGAPRAEGRWVQEPAKG